MFYSKTVKTQRYETKQKSKFEVGIANMSAVPNISTRRNVLAIHFQC